MQIRSSNFRLKLVNPAHAPTFQTFQSFQTPPWVLSNAKQGEVCIYWKPQMQHSGNTKKHVYNIVAVMIGLNVDQTVDLHVQMESLP